MSIPWKIIIAVTIAFLMGMGSIAYVIADHTGDATVTIPILITNDTTADAEDVQLSFNLSSQDLIDKFYIESDGFNSDIQKGSSHLAYMPGTGRVQLLACFANTSPETTLCNDASADDMTLPVTASDVFEFAFDNQARHLWVNTSTVGVADWTVQWQYYNGSAYVPLTGVSDGTGGFTVGGLQKVTWDFPAAGDWPESTLYSISGYWIRAEVTSATSVTTPPQGQQAWYETGRWWVVEPAIAADEEIIYSAQLGTSGVTSSNIAVLTDNDDGYLQGSGGSYPPSFSSTTMDVGNVFVRNGFSGGTYTFRVGLLRFDTSAIPDSASVTAASLTCRVVTVTDSADNRSLVFEWSPWETGGINHYETTSQNNAHSGTDLGSITANSDNTFTLTNLHNINKAGYTGIRSYISGGSPSFTNEVTLRAVESTIPCSLSVTWDTNAQFHYYIPHVDGYTITDDPALELGSVYQVTIAGRFGNAAAPFGTIGGAIEKGTDFAFIRSGIAGTVSNYSLLTNGAGVGSGFPLDGYHTVSITQGITGSVVVTVDGAEQFSGTRKTITDNASDWQFTEQVGTSGIPALPAMDYVQIEVNQTVQLIHQFRDLPGYQLEDWTGNGFDAVARYPDTISGYTVSLESAQTAAAGGQLDPEAGPEIVPAVGAIDNYSGVPTPGPNSFFINNIAQGVANDTGFPYEFLIGLPIIGLALGGIGFAAFVGLTHALFIAGIVELLLIAGWKMGMIPGWIPFLWMLIPVLFFLIWKQFRAGT